MIALAALLVAQTVAGSPLGAIPRQALPVSGCAAYLWTTGSPRTLIAMAGADGRLRLTIDGAAVDLARVGATPAAGFGFAGASVFGGSGIGVTLDLTVEPRSDLTQGAAVPAGTLRIERPGRDGVIVPVAGLIGCAA